MYQVSWYHGIINDSINSRPTQHQKRFNRVLYEHLRGYYSTVVAAHATPQQGVSLHVNSRLTAEVRLADIFVRHSTCPVGPLRHGNVTLPPHQLIQQRASLVHIARFAHTCDHSRASNTPVCLCVAPPGSSATRATCIAQQQCGSM